MRDTKKFCFMVSISITGTDLVLSCSILFAVAWIFFISKNFGYDKGYSDAMEDVNNNNFSHHFNNQNEH